MTLRSDLSSAIDTVFPILKKAYQDHIGPVVDDDIMKNRLLDRLTAAALLMRPPVDRTGPRHVETGSMGEAMRKFFLDGEIMPFSANITGIQTLKSLCFNRESNTVRMWGPSVLETTPRKMDDTLEPCLKTVYIVASAVEAIENNAKRVSPSDILSMFPRNLKIRREQAKFLVLSETMKGHDLEVTGTENRPNAGLADRYILVENWWPGICALDKTASTWKFGFAEIQGPGMCNGVAAMTDGSILMAGFVI